MAEFIFLLFLGCVSWASGYWIGHMNAKDAAEIDRVERKIDAIDVLEDHNFDPSAQAVFDAAFPKETNA